MLVNLCDIVQCDIVRCDIVHADVMEAAKSAGTNVTAAMFRGDRMGCFPCEWPTDRLRPPTTTSDDSMPMLMMIAACDDNLHPGSSAPSEGQPRDQA